MIKNKIYYLLLGLGLGIILTSSMNIVFNKTEKSEYTEEEIKEKARALGMISIKENIENKEKEKKDEDKKETQTKLEETSGTETKSEAQVKQESKGENKTVVINSDDTASTIISKLKTANIIENENEFRELVIKHNLQKKFRTGRYEIKSGMSNLEVLKNLILKSELKAAGLL